MLVTTPTLIIFRKSWHNGGVGEEWWCMSVWWDEPQSIDPRIPHVSKPVHVSINADVCSHVHFMLLVIYEKSLRRQRLGTPSRMYSTIKWKLSKQKYKKVWYRTPLIQNKADSVWVNVHLLVLILQKLFTHPSLLSYPPVPLHVFVFMGGTKFIKPPRLAQPMSPNLNISPLPSLCVRCVLMCKWWIVTQCDALKREGGTATYEPANGC